MITIKQSEAIIQDTKMREKAINFLLGVGLFKMLKDNQGTVSFRAVAKNEMNAYVVGPPYRGMLTIDASELKISAERRALCWVILKQPEMRVCLHPFLPHALCLVAVGIWTKHLKGKTDLHQTVIDRCIKTLTQKQLIKAVKSVKVLTTSSHFVPLG